MLANLHLKKYIKSIVYGGLDGIITTFAVVSGVVGGELNLAVVIILGFSNLLADGISMATGDYLSSKSEQEVISQEQGEFNLPLKNASMTFMSFFIFGLVPLLSYIVAQLLPIFRQHAFIVACCLTGVTLFCLGMVKSRITQVDRMKSGMEMLLIGGFAAFCAFIIGKVLGSWIA